MQRTKRRHVIRPKERRQKEMPEGKNWLAATASIQRPPAFIRSGGVVVGLFWLRRRN